MNKQHLNFSGMLIVILCFSTTVFALGHQTAGYVRQSTPAEKTQAHEQVMLAGGTTESGTMMKKTTSTLMVKGVKRKMGKKKPEKGIIFFAPKLEVREFSGDFEKWSKSIVRNEPGKLTFRWTTSMTKAKSARVEVREGAQLKSSKSLPSIPQPGQWQIFTLNYFSFRQTPKGIHTYTVRVVLYDDKFKQIGKPSNPVTITFNPTPQKKQKFTFDTLEVLSITPSGGTVTGPPAKNIKPGMLNSQNSIAITYKYNLVSEDTADIRQWLLEKGSKIASNNYWYFTRVYKNKPQGQATNRATILCNSDSQPEVVVTGIKYGFYAKNNKLVERIKTLPTPIHFRCPETPPPDSLMIINIKPSSLAGWGATATVIHGAKEGEPLNDSNSIKITYHYQLSSYPEGRIPQWALLANKDVAPNNFWTWSSAKKGDGTAVNRLTIRCLNNDQPDVQIKWIHYMMTGKSNNKTKVLIEKYQPVNYIFTCKEKRAMPLNKGDMTP